MQSDLKMRCPPKLSGETLCGGQRKGTITANLSHESGNCSENLKTKQADNQAAYMACLIFIWKLRSFRSAVLFKQLNMSGYSLEYINVQITMDIITRTSD